MTWDFPGCQPALTAKGRDNTPPPPGTDIGTTPRPAGTVVLPGPPVRQPDCSMEKPQITTLIKLRCAALDQPAGATDSMLAMVKSRCALRRWHQESSHLP